MLRLVDMCEWIEAGRRLLASDPGRFLLLLEAAERVVAIHESFADDSTPPPFGFVPPGDLKGSA